MVSKSARNKRLTIVIFGASGDLTHRKLAPALFHLQRSGALPQMCDFVGVARSDMNDESFRAALTESMGEMSSEDRKAWEVFTTNVRYIRGSSTDDESLKRIDDAVTAHSVNGHADNRIYYMALGPSLYADTLLAQKWLRKTEQWG